MSDRRSNLIGKFNKCVLLSFITMACLFSSSLAGAQTSVSATSVAFGNVVVNTTSAVKSVTLKNTGASSITISSLSVTAGTPYSISPSSTCLNPTLAAGASCTVALTDTPASLGAEPSGTLTIATTAPISGTQTVALSGTGVTATSLYPNPWNIGNVLVNTTSAAQSRTFTNNQSVPLSISSIAVTGTGFALDPSTTCANPGTLAAGASCKIAVTFNPTTLSTQPGTLTVAFNASGSPDTVALSGTGVNPTALSPTSIAFGNVAVNTASAAKAITLYNYQLTPITISPITVAAPYAISGGTCGTTLAASSSCTILITLTPTALGAVPATTLTVNTNASNTLAPVTLSGTGVNATALSATSMAFGNVVENTASAARSITLYNYQLTQLTITSITVPANYAVSGGTCPNSGTLAASSSCTILVTLTPTALGALPAGSLSISNNAAGSPLTAALSGTGIAPVTLSPATVAFGNVVVGQTSAIKTVTLTNNQSTSLSISSLAVTSGTPYAIDPSSTCLAPTVAAGASCTVALTLTPTATGVQPAGTLTISDSAVGSPQTVALSGTGVTAVTLSPSSVAFGSVAVNTTSATRAVTLKNSQSSSLSITSAIFNGPFALDTGATTTCPQAGGTIGGTLAAGASCVIGIDFKPTATGATAGGQITVIDSAANSPQVAALSGTGVVAVTLSHSYLGFGSVVVNTTSPVINTVVTNNQSVKLNLSSIAVTGPYAVAPATTTCIVGTPVVPFGNCNISTTFTPTALGVAPASTLTVTDDAANNPQSLPLTGTGIAAVTLSPATLAFGTVVTNEPVVKNVTLKNNQTSTLTISSITGFTGGYTPSSANTTCPVSPLTLPAGASAVRHK